ncbi:MAG: hypothetical protein ACRDY2_01855 [Acidimicrobiales bacterium]
MERRLPEKVVALSAGLRDAGIGHAFGGALALAYYAEPRATVDINLNVSVSSDRAVEVLAVLEALGAATDVDLALVRRGDWVRVEWDSTDVDVFFAFDEFHTRAVRASRTVAFAGTQIPILRGEHLVAFKVAFNRDKDWVDIQAMCQHGGLDGAEVNRSIAHLYAGSPRRARRQLRRFGAINRS